MIASIPCHHIHKAAKRALTNSKVKSSHGKHAAMMVGGVGVATASMIDTSESSEASSSTAANNADVPDDTDLRSVEERLKAAQAALAQNP